MRPSPSTVRPAVASRLHHFLMTIRVHMREPVREPNLLIVNWRTDAGTTLATTEE